MHDYKFLLKKAYQLRLDTMRAIHSGPIHHGHLGGCMSIAEMITALYYDVLRVDPKNPEWEGRDRFILSKGHCCLIWYAALADLGYFDKEIMNTYKAIGSILQGHPDCTKCPGVDATSGSLGQGLSIGFGMAMDAVRAGRDNQVYVMMSDGEMQAGMTWEAIMCISHYNPGNITLMIDRNNLQVNGFTQDIMNIEPLDDRLRSFGWDTIRIDGHDIEAVLSALYLAKANRKKPVCIICDTLKGKGVSYMENIMEWHAHEVSDEDYETAMRELEAIYKTL